MTNPTVDAADATWTSKTATVEAARVYREPPTQADGRSYTLEQGWAYDHRELYSWIEPSPKGAAHLARPRTYYTECGRHTRRWNGHWAKLLGPRSAADICQRCAERARKNTQALTDALAARAGAQ